MEEIEENADLYAEMLALLSHIFKEPVHRDSTPALSLVGTEEDTEPFVPVDEGFVWLEIN